MLTLPRSLGPCLGLLLLLLFGGTAAAQTPAAPDTRLPTAPLHEQVLDIPGDPTRPIRLQVTLYTPDGAGPFPLAVMNHGADHVGTNNRGERERFTVAAYYFLSRGYAVAMPMMRGFAGSGGKLFAAGCALDLVAEQNGRDVAAVIAQLSRHPAIDPTRVVVAGQSFGGWTTMGLGVAPPEAVRGLVMFNAALRTSDCPSQDRAMSASAARLGERTRLPSLWFYGDNDSVMPADSWHAVFQNYNALSGRARLVDIGTSRADSHQFLSDTGIMSRWTVPLDAFLTRVGLPAAVRFPGYLPLAAPPPSHFAALDDVAAVPFINDPGRALYRRFLARPLPRAFAISGTGSASEAYGGYDPNAQALRQCSRPGLACALYAVDNDVVWQGGLTGGPALETRVAKRLAMDRTAVLGLFYVLGPPCTPRVMPSVRVIAAPLHGTAWVGPRSGHPNYPAGSPFAACNTELIITTGLTYTPAPGFAGMDTLTVDETDAAGRHHVLRFDLTIGA